MPRSWLGFAAVLLVACSDDQGGDLVLDLDASVVIKCTEDPDAATALGVRGRDLWSVYGGTYTLDANRVAGRGLESASFAITIAPSAESVPGLDDCSSLAVPVRVMVKSADGAVNEDVLGVLRGTPLSASVAFATPEYMQNIQPRFYGNLTFRTGLPPQLRLRTDSHGSWIAPPIEQEKR